MIVVRFIALADTSKDSSGEATLDALIKVFIKWKIPPLKVIACTSDGIYKGKCKNVKISLQTFCLFLGGPEYWGPQIGAWALLKARFNGYMTRLHCANHRLQLCPNKVGLSKLTFSRHLCLSCVSL